MQVHVGGAGLIKVHAPCPPLLLSSFKPVSRCLVCTHDVRPGTELALPLFQRCTAISTLLILITLVIQHASPLPCRLSSFLPYFCGFFQVFIPLFQLFILLFHRVHPLHLFLFFCYLHSQRAHFLSHLFQLRISLVQPRSHSRHFLFRISHLHLLPSYLTLRIIQLSLALLQLLYRALIFGGERLVHFDQVLSFGLHLVKGSAQVGVGLFQLALLPLHAG
mmetsp:Transcript_37586/g.96992  ORF Transcript_37586/g.96992 Transcript_37586/m.96992 type:complete len:220 (-) Transcript_37586:1087-1746(-)